jgi:NADH:ubiquinone oxidoreductase subunit 6 (subunit J)
MRYLTREYILSLGLSPISSISYQYANISKSEGILKSEPLLLRTISNVDYSAYVCYFELVGTGTMCVTSINHPNVVYSCLCLVSLIIFQPTVLSV